MKHLVARTRVWGFVILNPGRTASQIAEKLHMTLPVVERIVGELRAEGKIEEHRW